MKISFGGNLLLKNCRYLIKKQDGTEADNRKPLEINTNQVAYTESNIGELGMEFHMSNGDTIITKTPFDERVYSIARQLGPDKTIGYNFEDEIIIEDCNIEKLKEQLDIKA